MTTNDNVNSSCAGHEEPECAGESPEVHAATEAVRRAKEELKKAQECCEEVRRRAAEKLEAVRKTTVGEVFDAGLGLIKKHPGPGMIVAAAAGFFLGRLFRGRR
jgi:ElaB/YqjD/DUF883 family membrane-anchored ribosome-binding protein